MSNYRTLLGKVRRRILRQLGRGNTSPPAYTLPPGHIIQPQKGLYFVLDHPTMPAVEVHAGVLSLRGWAWSREAGAGTLFLEIQNGHGVQRQPIPHRYCRFDLSQVIPDIPLDNYAGFEISIDRFDLPDQAALTLVYEASAATHRLNPIQVTANHAQHIAIASPLEEIVCDCCAGTDLAMVGIKEGLALRRCQNCGLVFTSPRPDFSRIRQRYSTDYFEKEYLPGIHAQFEGLKLHWNNILDHVEPFKRVSPYLFEVGTGAGYLLQEANRRGWIASGIDLNPTAVNYAQKQLGLEVVEAEIHQINLPANKFGAIISESTLEHFLSPRQVITKCAQALHPGGSLFIWTLGDEGDLMMTQGMDFIYVGPSEHLYHFPTSALSRLCELAGLRVEHFWRDDTKDSVALVASKRLDRWE